MKQKHIIIASLLIAAGIFSSCSEGEYFLGEDEELGILIEEPYELSCKLQFDSSTPDENGFNITCQNIPWQFTGYPEWIQISPDKGDKSAFASLRIEDNPSADARIANYTFSPQDTEKWPYSNEYYLWQNGVEPYLYVNLTGVEPGAEEVYLSADAKAGSYELNLSTNLDDISCQVDCGWPMQANVSGKTLTLDFPENTSITERSAMIVLCGSYQYYDNNSNLQTDKVYYYIYLTQLAANITASVEQLTFGKEKSSQSIKISSDVAWTASTAKTWIDIDKKEGKAGETELVVSVTENVSALERTGAVYVYVDEETAIRIPVCQKGCEFKYLSGIEENFIQLGDGATSGTITIETDFPKWKVASCPSWLTITPAEGVAGKHTLTYSAEDNPNTTEREGSVNFSFDGISYSASFGVCQRAKTFGDLSSTVQFENTASSSSVTIPTNGTWSATTTSDWITLSPTSGSGSDKLTISVSANPQDDDRRGVVKVSVGEETKQFTVIQKGIYFTIDQSTLSPIGSKGGSLYLAITTNQSWTAAIAGKSSWLTLSATSGTGSTTLKITAADNASITERKDTVVLTRANKQSICLIVRQLGRYLTISRKQCDFFYKGGTAESIIVNTDGTWSAETDETYNWLTMNTLSGTNGNTITLTAQPNDTKQNRTAKIVVYLHNVDGENTKVRMAYIYVTQYGAGTHFTIENYGEDHNLDIDYGENITITTSEWGEDINFGDNATGTINISTSGWGTDKSYE